MAMDKSEIYFSYEAKKWNISHDARKEFFEVFGNIDIDSILQDTRIWLLANSHKRKKNFKRFLYNWIRRSQRPNNFYKPKPKKVMKKKGPQIPGIDNIPVELREDYKKNWEKDNA